MKHNILCHLFMRKILGKNDLEQFWLIATIWMTQTRQAEFRFSNLKVCGLCLEVCVKLEEIQQVYFTHSSCGTGNWKGFLWNNNLIYPSRFRNLYSLTKLDKSWRRQRWTAQMPLLRHRKPRSLVSHLRRTDIILVYISLEHIGQVWIWPLIIHMWSRVQDSHWSLS